MLVHKLLRMGFTVLDGEKVMDLLTDCLITKSKWVFMLHFEVQFRADWIAVVRPYWFDKNLSIVKK